MISFLTLGGAPVQGSSPERLPLTERASSEGPPKAEGAPPEGPPAAAASLSGPSPPQGKGPLVSERPPQPSLLSLAFSGSPLGGPPVPVSGGPLREESVDDSFFASLPVFLQGLIGVSLLSVCLSLACFLYFSLSHLLNYYEPKLQRMICRIGCALPLFAILSTAACFAVLSDLSDADGDPWGPPSSILTGSSTSPLPLSAVPTQTDQGASGGATVEPSWFQGTPSRELAAVPDPQGGPPALRGASPSTEVDVQHAQGGPLGAPPVWGPPSATPSVPSFGAPEAAEARPTTRPQGAPIEPPSGAPKEAIYGAPEGPHSRGLREGVDRGYRRSFYVQRQMMLELGKQLVQSTALYSFSSLMVNACGEASGPRV